MKFLLKVWVQSFFQSVECFTPVKIQNLPKNQNEKKCLHGWVSSDRFLHSHQSVSCTEKKKWTDASRVLLQWDFWLIFLTDGHWSWQNKISHPKHIKCQLTCLILQNGWVHCTVRNGPFLNPKCKCHCLRTERALATLWSRFCAFVCFSESYFVQAQLWDSITWNKWTWIMGGLKLQLETKFKKMCSL